MSNNIYMKQWIWLLIHSLISDHARKREGLASVSNAGKPLGKQQDTVRNTPTEYTLGRRGATIYRWLSTRLQ